MSCPLCNENTSRPAWIGSTVYREKEFPYVECLKCGSIYCSPMPDETMLAAMYGEDYQQFLAAEESHSGQEGVIKVLNWLSRQEKGVFLDYGCGAGNMLREIAKLGWDCVGVEFDPATAEKYSRLHSLTIVSALEDLPADFRADAIHLGDVIEHLTDVNRQFPEVLKRLRKNGVIIAQGPLDAHFNLFLLGIRLARLVRSRPSEMPPYHVSLATARGQEMFFTRFNLKKVVFTIFEDAHPAPGRLRLAEITKLRLSGLFLLRKISQAFSKLSGGRLGNRYFYIGRKNG
jgi:SAM-dependent methyltransferase